MRSWYGNPILLLALLAVVVPAVAGCGQRAPADTGPTAADRDAAAIRNLADAGVDLTQPQPVQFYLYFPNKDSAGAVAAVLQMEGYQSASGQARGEDRWLVLAARSMVVAPEAIAAARKEMEELAKGGRGEFDGWEVAVGS